MKVLIFYRPDSEGARAVEEFMHDFSRRFPEAEPRLVDVDSVDGIQKSGLYDVMRYPTVLALDPNGTVLQRWDSGMMPLMNEVAYYANR